MLAVILCSIFLLGGSLGLPSANQYVDTVIHTALQNVVRNEKLDPTHLADFTHNYKDKTFLGKVKGEANYYDGSLSGLSQVSRITDCQGPANSSSATLINCTLSLNYLKTSYKAKVKYGVLPKITIDAKADVSNTVVDVGIVKGLHERQPRLEKFTIRQFGSLTTHFTGLGPLNKHMKVLEEYYKSQVSLEVTNVIINRFRYALNLAVPQVPMPLR